MPIGEPGMGQGLGMWVVLAIVVIGGLLLLTGRLKVA